MIGQIYSMKKYSNVWDQEDANYDYYLLKSDSIQKKTDSLLNFSLELIDRQDSIILQQLKYIDELEQLYGNGVKERLEYYDKYDSLKKELESHLSKFKTT